MLLISGVLSSYLAVVNNVLACLLLDRGKLEVREGLAQSINEALGGHRGSLGDKMTPFRFRNVFCTDVATGNIPHIAHPWHDGVLCTLQQVLQVCKAQMTDAGNLAVYMLS